MYATSGNPLWRLKRGVFHASGLMHLQRIYLSRYNT
ncbi:hypothetical protein B4U80_04827 [Leptotrombidium deliense]|uniref:Uncharacterized protein n=1 Tax=Leptotrombidium deliense TaxID=299467 RepID=A0A443RS36_9ACAR|nr:hypothetical protein B4U80_04827 [Leptotrombidium deliense]